MTNVSLTNSGLFDIRFFSFRSNSVFVRKNIFPLYPGRNGGGKKPIKTSIFYENQLVRHPSTKQDGI